MVGKYQAGPGYEPEGQGTHARRGTRRPSVGGASGSQGDGEVDLPRLPVAALSVSFLMGSMCAAASGYGWYGILVVGFGAVLVCGVINIFRHAHAAHVARKTLWTERDR